MGERIGRRLNQEWGVNALHALYRKNGRWYHQLVNFPGALFDAAGYIVFPNEQAYRNCPYLSIGVHINLANPQGISAIPGYIRIK